MSIFLLSVVIMGMDLVGAGLHVLKGAVYGALGYLGGDFAGSIWTALGFSTTVAPLLAPIVGALVFVGYAVDKVIEYHEKAIAEAKQ